MKTPGLYHKLNCYRAGMVLCFMLILSVSQLQAKWQPGPCPLMTQWAKDVSPDNIHPEYPRPQMVRNQWLSLNGLWDYAITPKDNPQPKEYHGQILVPFPIESALSGVAKTVGPENKLWYRRTFKLPAWGDQQIILHFQAVDWDAAVWVNGKEIGSHKGGYDPFSFDITEALKSAGEQEIVISVWDPTDTSWQPRGKQVRNPQSIWYTCVTGIWQSVWLEPVNKEHIKSLKIIPDIDAKVVRIKADCSTSSKKHDIEFIIKQNAGRMGLFRTRVHATAEIPVRNPQLWSPDSPFLYDLEVHLKDNAGNTLDTVTSYFGMRKISLGKDKDGITRMMLNNEFLFQLGPLDQGWWPDGLYTTPTDDALKYDIEVTKKLGFNMARKHVKVEPARWYYWCDKLGLLVWQDMPSAFKTIEPGEAETARTKESSAQFYKELKHMIDYFYNHPSIIVWVPFNEGWGQFETAEVVDFIKGIDSSRLINSASGWTDHGVGDINDVHAYPGPAMPDVEEKRAVVLGEFGGLGLPLEGHTWQDKNNWGYRSFQNTDELARAYQELFTQLQPYIAKGLSAAVYTQTTDVEVEVNGLMTYDRAIIKINPEKLKRFNQGYLPPTMESNDEIFLKTGHVKLYNVSNQGEIRFTLDGREPGRDSMLYTDLIELTKTTSIKARTIWPDGSYSDVSELTCKKVTPLKSKDDIENLQAGLKFTYYEEDGKTWNTIPDFNTLKPEDSGIATNINLNHAPRHDYIALTFEGYIRIPEEGIYTFYTNSDDGSRLYIDSTLVVDNDLVHGEQEKSGKIALTAGVFPLKVTFFQGMGGRSLQVLYQGPDIPKREIPENCLFHLNSD
ncbi:MAG: chitobiase/beta-hexosaminidase C-terminal domain-containing protein [Sedimentisphaerales bacterium]|nr:chitobiase/beta-hexosaminidase C-terminal domain-containing protein [Sedimentisphaerales bacterium]